MIKNVFASTVAFAIASTSAQAHVGPALLITGSDTPRAAKTAGVTYKTVNNVHLFQGTPKLLGDDTIDQRGSNERIELRYEIRDFEFRRREARRLCTQGFFSGKCKRNTFRFTQGFFSGGSAGRR